MGGVSILVEQQLLLTCFLGKHPVPAVLTVMS